MVLARLQARPADQAAVHASATALTWRMSVPQHPPSTRRFGNRLRRSLYASPSSAGLPSSSCSASSSSAWLSREAFARSAPTRLSHGSWLEGRPALMWSGCAQLTMNQAADDPVASSTRSTASPSGVPDASRPSVSTVKPTTAGTPRSAALRLPRRLPPRTRTSTR